MEDTKPAIGAVKIQSGDEIVPTIPDSLKRKNPQAAQSKRARAAKCEIKPVYSLGGGLRTVEPYDFVFSTFAKERWLKRDILSVFSKEFNYFRSSLYYKWAIERGQIRVNGEAVDCAYLIQNSDLVESQHHRHEPPVTDAKIEVVHEDDEMLVVSKPCSIPIHPTGKYRHNTLLHLLKYTMGYENIHFINRIDRLTSGLVLIAKNKTKAKELCDIMQKRDIQKTYLARVKGEFPEGFIECNEPIANISQKVGVQIVSPDGKPCTTTFKRLSYNGITSLVECRPKTGRTHQIRVHLQFLGYPIANDPHYCSAVWGEGYAKGGLDLSKLDAFLARFLVQTFPADAETEESFQGCVECRDVRVAPLPEQICLWLHSLRYEGKGWMYETKYPDWALEGWDGDRDVEERFWKFGGKWDGLQSGEFVSN